MSNVKLDRRDALLGKIRALRARTVERGCTEAEAEAAAAMAGKLMDQYGFAQADLREADALVQRVVDLQGRAVGHVQWCVLAIAAYCDCRVWRSGRPGSKAWAPVYLGHAADVEVAEYLTVLLADATAQAWRAYAGLHVGIDGKQRRKGQESFTIGMSKRLGERLREMKALRNRGVDEASGVTVGALVLVKSAAVDAAYAEIQQRFKPSRPPRARNVYADAHSAGARAADAVAINAAVAAAA